MTSGTKARPRRPKAQRRAGAWNDLLDLSRILSEKLRIERAPVDLVAQLHDTSTGCNRSRTPRARRSCASRAHGFADHLGDARPPRPLVRNLAADSPGPGRGVTFTVRLPVSNVLLPAPPSRRPDESPVDLRSVSVLLVEDDVDWREAVAIQLRQAGADVM